MTRIIVQYSFTFLVDAEAVKDAAALVLDSITVEPQPGVTPAGRKLSALDPFEDHIGDVI